MLNPDLSRLYPYPFERLAELLGSVTPAALTPIPLSIGEPKHAPPAHVIQALTEALSMLSVYPSTKGSPELRDAIAQWATRRFGLQAESLSSARHVLPVNGTREAIFAAVQVAADRREGGTVLLPNPFYQIYEGAALMAGLEPVYLPITASGQPDFDAVTEAQWRRCQYLFLCTPGNPTGTPLTLDTLCRLIHLADTFDFWIGSDECYSELYRDDPPLGLLEACAAMGRHDYRRCMVFHSLSKRSNLPGLRSGFVAGDADFMAAFLTYRTYHGCSMSLPVQHASIAAWSDEAHVATNRKLYRRKFEDAKTILHDVLPIHDSGYGFYLWVRTPVPCDVFAKGLYASQHVTVLPGQYLGRAVDGVNPGAGFVRMALVAEPAVCREALYRIRTYVETLPQ